MTIGYFKSTDTEAFSDIAKKAYDYFDNMSAEAIASDVTELQASARNFLTIYKNFMIYESDFNAINKQNAKLRKANQPIISISDELRKNRNLNLTQASIAAELFAKAVNKFLGQSLQTIIVYEDRDKQPHLFAVDAIDYKNLFIARKQGAFFSFTPTSLKALQNSKKLTEQLLTQHQEKFKKSLNVQGLNKTYTEILRRFDKYTGRASGKQQQDKDGKTYLFNSAVVHIIIWRTEGYGDWRLFIMSNRGDIKEAYVAIMFDSARRFNFARGNIDLFIDKYAPYIQQVDSARGRLLGDVSLNISNNRRLELAVKSSDASPMGINSIVELAQAIINTKPSQIKKMLKNMRKADEAAGATRNTIYQLNSLSKTAQWLSKITDQDVLDQVDEEVILGLKANFMKNPSVTVIT